VTRAFVAVRVPEAVLDAVDARLADLVVPGRRTTRAQWHLTLQFLGDGAHVDEVAAALEGISAAPDPARVGGAGAFPDARRALVFWLGLAEGSALLAGLAGAVGERLAPLGYEADPRPFVPHLTLARLRVPTDLRSTIATFGDAAIGPAWEVDAVTVYESRLRSEGAEYAERSTIRFRRESPQT
jgi:2'-5' RNA ligase